VDGAAPPYEPIQTFTGELDIARSQKVSAIGLSDVHAERGLMA